MKEGDASKRWPVTNSLLKIIPTEKFYADERGGIYRFLWREFQESANQTAGAVGRERRIVWMKKVW